MAMAGSIYMRKVSLEMKKENDDKLERSSYRNKESSFGKIIRNNNKKS